MTNEKLKILAEAAMKARTAPEYMAKCAALAYAASPGVVLALLRENEAQAARIKELEAERDANFAAFHETCVISAKRGSEIDALAKDAARYRWLADYLVGTRTDLDNVIVAAKTVDELTQVLNQAVKGPTP